MSVVCLPHCQFTRDLIEDATTKQSLVHSTSCDLRAFVVMSVPRRQRRCSSARMHKARLPAHQLAGLEKLVQMPLGDGGHRAFLLVFHDKPATLSASATLRQFYFPSIALRRIETAERKRSTATRIPARHFTSHARPSAFAADSRVPCQALPQSPKRPILLIGPPPRRIPPRDIIGRARPAYRRRATRSSTAVR